VDNVNIGRVVSRNATFADVVLFGNFRRARVGSVDVHSDTVLAQPSIWIRGADGTFVSDVTVDAANWSGKDSPLVDSRNTNIRINTGNPHTYPAFPDAAPWLQSLPGEWAGAVRDWVADLKAAGVWDLISVAWLPCLGSDAGRINMRNPRAFTLPETAGVTEIDGFGAWADTDTVIDTGFNPTASGLEADDWHMSVHLPNNTDKVQVIDGASTWGFGNNFHPMIGSADGRWRMAPMGTDQNIRIATGAANGYGSIGDALSVQTHLGNRIVCSDGTDFTGYLNGANIGTLAVATPYLPDSNVQLLGAGVEISDVVSQQYNGHPLAAATIGRRLTDAQAKALSDATSRLTLAIGADKAHITPRRVTKTPAVNPVTGPSRVVDFKLGVGLDHVTYSRTGATTVLGRSGFFETVAEDVEPIAYDPISRVPLGLQTYAGFTQREVNSQLSSDASYVKSAMGVASASGVYGLDGTTSGVFTLTADGTTAEHSISRTYTGLARYVCAQIWFKEPTASARAQELIALRVRSKDDVENYAIMAKSSRQVVTFGDNIIEVGGRPRAGYSETGDERTELYLAVDTTTETDVDVRVSLVVIDPTYPMDGSDPAAYVVNDAEDVTNLLGWQVTDSATMLEAYPKPYQKSTGSAVTVNDHETVISLSGLDTSKDLWLVMRLQDQFIASTNSAAARFYNGSTIVGVIAHTSSINPFRLNAQWTGSGGISIPIVADNIFDGAFVTCALGRSIQFDKQYTASNQRAYNDFDRSGWTGGAPDLLYIGCGGPAGPRQFGGIFERVEIWTSRPLVAEIESRVHFDGGTYGRAAVADLEAAGFEGVWQPWLGMRPTSAGTQPVIAAMLASAYNTAGSVVTGTDQVAFCAGGANYALRQIGISPPVNLWASSFMGAGGDVGLDPDDWQKWDVILLRDNNGDEDVDRVGHVAFLLRVEGTTALVMGANNNGSQIGVAAYPVADVIGVRRITEEFAA
jgi:hypothetical protein